MYKINYDKKKYDFRKLLSNLFEIENLENIHNFFPKNQNIFDMTNNSKTKFHEIFYDRLNSGWEEFHDIYKNLIKDVIKENFNEMILYQTKPTLRIHIVGNWATPEFHCDSQPGYNHPKGEVNFIIPITKCYGSNAVWCESEPDKKDYKPMEGKYGEIISFNGNILKHGNKINNETDSRISFDFRILPISKYNPKNHKFTSGTRNLKFEIGSYYSSLS